MLQLKNIENNWEDWAWIKFALSLNETKTYATACSFPIIKTKPEFCWFRFFKNTQSRGKDFLGICMYLFPINFHFSYWRQWWIYRLGRNGTEAWKPADAGWYVVYPRQESNLDLWFRKPLFPARTYRSVRAVSVEPRLNDFPALTIFNLARVGQVRGQK